MTLTQILRLLACTGALAVTFALSGTALAADDDVNFDHVGSVKGTDGRELSVEVGTTDMQGENGTEKAKAVVLILPPLSGEGDNIVSVLWPDEATNVGLMSSIVGMDMSLVDILDDQRPVHYVYGVAPDEDGGLELEANLEPHKATATLRLSGGSDSDHRFGLDADELSTFNDLLTKAGEMISPSDAESGETKS